MKEWIRLLERGKRELSRHNPLKALRELQKALEICPVSKKGDTAKILFYTGVSLHKLGFRGVAVRTWNAASRLKKDGPCRRMVDRMTNDYGMTVKGNDDDCDFRAFHAIQLSRYLITRGTKKFGSMAERDMVEELIQSAWEMTVDSFSLEGLSAGERLSLFREQVVIFPFLECPDNWSCNEIQFDFRRNSRIMPESNCSCGSGRSNMTCCGRIPSEDELTSGLF